MTTCQLVDCHMPKASRGYCSKHYSRVRKYGNPHTVKRVCTPAPVPERFWRRVEKTPTCWLWTGGKTKGYGVFWNGERVVYAHRWSYEHHVAPIPAGLDMDHLCRTPACVRPGHLEPVTRQENAIRGARHGAPRIVPIGDLA